MHLLHSPELKGTVSFESSHQKKSDMKWALTEEDIESFDYGMSIVSALEFER